LPVASLEDHPTSALPSEWSLGVIKSEFKQLFNQFTAGFVSLGINNFRSFVLVNQDCVKVGIYAGELTSEYSRSKNEMKWVSMKESINRTSKPWFLCNST
jgi:hypothetical protein